MTEKLRTVPQLSPSRFALSEHAQVVYTVTVESNVTRDDLKDPSFYAHVAAMLRPNYEIKVFSDDGRFHAHYLVLAAEKTWARVFELSYYDLTLVELTDEQQAKIAEEYLCSFGGPEKWRVIRKSDNAKLITGLHSKADAEQWLRIHLNQQTNRIAA